MSMNDCLSKEDNLKDLFLSIITVLIVISDIITLKLFSDINLPELLIANVSILALLMTFRTTLFKKSLRIHKDKWKDLAPFSLDYLSPVYLLCTVVLINSILSGMYGYIVSNKFNLSDIFQYDSFLSLMNSIIYSYPDAFKWNFLHSFISIIIIGVFCYFINEGKYIKISSGYLIISLLFLAGWLSSFIYTPIGTFIGILKYLTPESLNRQFYIFFIVSSCLGILTAIVCHYLVLIFKKEYRLIISNYIDSLVFFCGLVVLSINFTSFISNLPTEMKDISYLLFLPHFYIMFIGIFDITFRVIFCFRIRKLQKICF